MKSECKKHIYMIYHDCETPHVTWQVREMFEVPVMAIVGWGTDKTRMPELALENIFTIMTIWMVIIIMTIIIIYYYEMDMKDDNDVDGDGWLKYWQDQNAFACPTQNCGGDNDVEKLIMVIMWRSDGWVGEYEN